MLSKFVSKISIYFSVSLGPHQKLTQPARSKVGWIELLKTHSITQPTLGYDEMG